MRDAAVPARGKDAFPERTDEGRGGEGNSALISRTWERLLGFFPAILLVAGIAIKGVVPSRISLGILKGVIGSPIGVATALLDGELPIGVPLRWSVAWVL